MFLQKVFNYIVTLVWLTATSIPICVNEWKREKISMSMGFTFQAKYPIE